jgi:hypothetical protein
MLIETYNEEKQEELERFEEAKRQLKAQKLDQMIETGETTEIKVSLSVSLPVLIRRLFLGYHAIRTYMK